MNLLDGSFGDKDKAVGNWNLYNRLQEELSLAQHRMSGDLARGGIHPDLIRNINNAELNLLKTIIIGNGDLASESVTKARQNLDLRYDWIFGKHHDGRDHSEVLAERIGAALDRRARLSLDGGSLSR